jgi:hypothetical protein
MCDYCWPRAEGTVYSTTTTNRVQITDLRSGVKFWPWETEPRYTVSAD